MCNRTDKIHIVIFIIIMDNISSEELIKATAKKVINILIIPKFIQKRGKRGQETTWKWFFVNFFNNTHIIEIISLYKHLFNLFRHQSFDKIRNKSFSQISATGFITKYKTTCPYIFRNITSVIKARIGTCSQNTRNPRFMSAQCTGSSKNITLCFTDRSRKNLFEARSKYTTYFGRNYPRTIKEDCLDFIT